MFCILQYVREMQDENNVTIVNEKYEQGHTESDFILSVQMPKSDTALKHYGRDLNSTPKISPMK